MIWIVLRLLLLLWLLFVSSSFPWCVTEEQMASEVGSWGHVTDWAQGSPSFVPHLPTFSAYPFYPKSPYHGEMEQKLEWLLESFYAHIFGVVLPDLQGERSLPYRMKGSLPHRVGPLLTTQNSEAQRWARAYPGCIWQSILVSGRLPHHCHSPCVILTWGYMWLQQGNWEVPRIPQQAWAGSGQTALKLCLELAFSFQYCTPVTGHASMCLHWDLVACVCLRSSAKKDGSCPWVVRQHG